VPQSGVLGQLVLFDFGLFYMARGLTVHDPPARFTTNASESLNAVLKAGVQYKKSELPAFIQKLQKLVVDEQEREFERAIIDRGKYRLQAQFSHLQVPELKWFSQMSEQQRASHLKKVAETYLTKSLPDCDMQDGAGNQPLSIDVHDTGLSVPQGIVD